MKLAKDIQTTGAGMTASDNYQARRIAGTRLAECLAHRMVVSPKRKCFFIKQDNNFVTPHSTIYLFCTVRSDTKFFERIEKKWV